MNEIILPIICLSLIFIFIVTIILIIFIRTRENYIEENRIEELKKAQILFESQRGYKPNLETIKVRYKDNGEIYIMDVDKKVNLIIKRKGEL